MTEPNDNIESFPDETDTPMTYSVPRTRAKKKNLFKRLTKVCKKKKIHLFVAPMDTPLSEPSTASSRTSSFCEVETDQEHPPQEQAELPFYSPAMKIRRERLAAMAECVKATRSAFKKDWSRSKVCVNFDKTLDFFQKLKPCTFVVLLRALVEGSTSLRIAAVISLFEQIGLAYRPDVLTSTYVWVLDFVGFMIDMYSQAAVVRTQASARERIEELIGFKLPDIPEWLMITVAAVIGFITLITGGLVNFFATSKHNFSSFLRGFGESAKTAGATGSALMVFMKVTKFLLKSAGFEIEEDKLTTSLLQEFSDFDDNIEERLDEIRKNPFKVADGTIKTAELISEAVDWEKWFREVSADGSMRNHTGLYTRCVSARTTMITVKKDIQRNVGEKQVPVVVWLWGQPGVGKSTSISTVIDELSRIEGRTLSSYARATDDAFWSGYEQQDVVIYDDFSVDSEDQTDARELMRIHTNANYSLNMADLADKGTCFRSRYILIASNYDTAVSKLNFGAIHRRRDFMYVTWNTKLTEHMRSGEDISSFDNYDDYEAAMCYQAYAYDTARGEPASDASGTRKVGPILKGLDGLKTIAERAHTRMLRRREQYIVILKKKLASTKDNIQDATVAPGVTQDEILEEDMEIGQDEVDNSPTDEHAEAMFPIQLDRAFHTGHHFRGNRRRRRDDVELHASTPEPLVFIFYGDAGTGKTTLAHQLVENLRVPEEHILNDPIDTDDKFAALTEQIRSYGDLGRPLIVTLNTDRFKAWHEDLSKSVDFFDRTSRRVHLYAFERFKGGLFRKKVVIETMHEGNFECNNIIHEVAFRRLTVGSQVSRLHISDFFFSSLGRIFVGHYQKDYTYCIPLPDCVKIPLRGLALSSGPRPDEVMKAIPWSSLIRLAKYRTFAYKVAASLVNIKFNEMTPEGFVRQFNDIRLETEISETLCLQFKEGDFYTINMDGIAVMALGHERKLLISDGKFYFANFDGSDKVILNEDEVRFHKLAMGDKFDLISVDDCDLPYAKAPSYDFQVDAADKILQAFAVLISTSVVAMNLVELLTPKKVELEGRTAARTKRAQELRMTVDAGEEEEGLSWANDSYDEYKENFDVRDPRARKGNLPYDYDDAPVSRPGLYYSESAGRDRYVERETALKAESGEVISKPVKAKVVVESGEQVVVPTIHKVRVEYMDEMKQHSARLTSLRHAPPKKGAEIYSDLKEQEKYHFIDFKTNVWCPAYVTSKKVKGGTAIDHHRCKSCKSIVLKLWNSSNFAARVCYQCRGYSMPDQYFHSGCTHCEGKLERPSTEGSIDPSFSDVHTKVVKNLVSFRGFHGLMLQGNLGAAPNHCMPHDSFVTASGHKAVVKKRIPHKDLCFFLLEANKKYLGAFPDITHFLLKKGDSVPRKTKAMITVPRAKIMMTVPIIVNQLVKVHPLEMDEPITALSTKLTTGGTFDTYFTEKGDCGSVVLAMNPATMRKIIGLHVAGSSTEGFVSHITQEDIPVVTQAARPRLPMERILDLQYDKAFYSDNVNTWCPFLHSGDPGVTHLCSQCKRYCLELHTNKGAGRTCCHECAGFEVPDYYFHNRRICANCAMTKLMKREGSIEYAVKATQQILPADGLVGETLEVFGVTLDSKGETHNKHLSGRTKLRVSPFRTDHYGVPYEPAILSRSDARNTDNVDPYLKNVDKWDRERPICDQAELNDMMREMGLWFAQKIKQRQLMTSVLTMEEAINRDTTHCKSNPIYMHSSAGFPFNTFPRVNQKFPMLVFDEKLNRYRVDKETYEGWLLTQHVEYIRDNARKGQKVMCVFDVNLKDESLPKRKIDDVKTRSIAGSPLDFTLLFRMYFHTIGAAMMEIRDLTPIKLGIAPNTMEWHELATYMTEFGTNGFDGDYRHWDASCTEEEILACAHFYNAIAQECDPDWKEEDDHIRMTMYQMLSKPLITRGSLVVQSKGGVISGQPHTSVDNSIINMVNIWKAWKAYVAIKNMKPSHSTFRGMQSSVRSCVVGDDNAHVPKPQYRDFNFEFVRDSVKSSGKEYTPSVKTDLSSNKHISQMTFLKRHFLYLPETAPYCVGGLVDEAFNKMTSCARVSVSRRYEAGCGVEFDDTIHQTVETYLAEASLRGKDFYDWAVRHIKERCEKYSIPYEVPYSWNHQFNLIFHDFNVNYVNVFM